MCRRESAPPKSGCLMKHEALLYFADECLTYTLFTSARRLRHLQIIRLYSLAVKLRALDLTMVPATATIDLSLLREMHVVGIRRQRLLVPYTIKYFAVIYAYGLPFKNADNETHTYKKPFFRLCPENKEKISTHIATSRSED